MKINLINLGQDTHSLNYENKNLLSQQFGN